MKRSEALTILIIEGPWGMDKSFAEDMLSALEKAGMLPPACMIEIDNFQADGILTAYNLENKWESEDD